MEQHLPSPKSLKIVQPFVELNQLDNNQFTSTGKPTRESGTLQRLRFLEIWWVHLFFLPLLAPQLPLNKSSWFKLKTTQQILVKHVFILCCIVCQVWMNCIGGTWKSQNVYHKMHDGWKRRGRLLLNEAHEPSYKLFYLHSMSKRLKTFTPKISNEWSHMD